MAGKKLGLRWTSKIYFDPEADKPSQCHEINDEALIEKLKHLVDINEIIIQATMYKLPLSTWQLTQFVFYHNIVLFETRSWWWTIEKNSAGITIQRSKSKSAVKDYFRREKRNPGMREVSQGVGVSSVGRLFEWLYKEDELNKRYNYIWSNCQHFAKRAFNFVIGDPSVKDIIIGAIFSK